MQKPIIENEAITRRTLWNRSDLKVYAQPVERSTTERKREAREQLSSDVERFLARGGKIDVLEPEDSGYEPGPKAFCISAKTNSRAT